MADKVCKVIIRSFLIMLITFSLKSGLSAEENVSIKYQYYAGESYALICQPKEAGPFPVVIYNHGKIVDTEGYNKAKSIGYDVEGICAEIAKRGFIVFAPIRRSGSENIEGHKEEVFRAIDYAKTLPNSVPAKLAVIGFSRGGLFTLMAAIERQDAKAIILLAPAPWGTSAGESLKNVDLVSGPVLMLVDKNDAPQILENFEMIEKSLSVAEKEVKIIRYNSKGGHRLFWKKGYYIDDIVAFLKQELD